MSTFTVQTQHASPVGELADRYRREGYEVVVEPEGSKHRHHAVMIRLWKPNEGG